MKITVNTIKKTVLLTGGLFLSSLSIIKADDSGLTPELLRPQFSNLTPEAASLGRYGAFQVSEYSGAANISIPLYTVKSGDVSFPICLYYDATGIKVEQDATMVGLGWNLSYGGMISHIVCGEDDFREYNGYSEFNQNWWKEKLKEIRYKIFNDAPWYLENYIQKWTGETFIYGSPNNTGTNFWSEHAVWGGSPRDKDLQIYINMTKGYGIPDVFHASFCGHNISFTIDKRAGIGSNKLYPIKILNNNPRKYKISYESAPNKEPSGSYEYPTSFYITDDKGITYCFTGYSESSFICIDSYYLTKIYGPDGEKGKSVIELKYEPKDILFGEFGTTRTATKNHMPSVKRIHNSWDHIQPVESVSRAYNNLISPQSWATEVACNSSHFCKKVYPTCIVTAFDSIVFQKGERKDLNGAMEIDRIVIHSKIGNAKKYIKFEYHYFSETPARETQRQMYSHKRLKLENVTVDDQKYTFEYRDSVLPSFNSYSKDYWGYYNGAASDAYQFVGCSPAYTISNGVVSPVDHLDGSNRLTSEELCKVGMLKKITYPTGGYTLYEFEANRFNDKYYYPDASKSKISFPAAVNTYSDGSIYMYGTKTQTMTIKASQVKYDIKVVAFLKETSENLTVTVKNSSGAVVKTVTYKGSKNISETVPVSLTTDETYTIEAKLTAVQANSSSTVAQLSVSHDVANTNITASPSTKNENGGYSIGGGVRIKSIKNYDSDNTYHNGVKYEYSGGKLLSPTVHLETHYVRFSHPDDRGPYPTDFSINYANTEPSYLYICSLGVPATVGYDKVVKKEIDESENVTYRKTVLDFHNYGYESSSPADQINKLMQNAFYYMPYNKGQLNGMIKTDSVFAGSVLASTSRYDYGSTPIDTIYYQKCLPLHLPGTDYSGMDFNTTFFRKCNTWTYLTKKKETFYDSNGKETTGNLTQYAYNENNYQPLRVTVYDEQKQNSRCTCLYYPSDKGMAGGSDYLIQKHNLSEVVRTYVYDDIFNTNKFVGGSYNNYVLRNNIPVVSECRSITPAWSTVLEMEVTKHDGYGNIREYKKKNGTPVTVIWSYNHQLPIMEIVGCTYDEACSKATSLSSLENKASVSETTMASIHSTLMKGLPNALVTAYTYSPWQSVSQIIKPNGEKTVYSYDGYGRLTTVLDANQSTFQPIQMYNYNYKNK